MKLFLESTPGFSSVSILGDNCCKSEFIIIDATLHQDAFWYHILIRYHKHQPVLITCQTCNGDRSTGVIFTVGIFIEVRFHQICRVVVSA